MTPADRRRVLARLREAAAGRSDARRWLARRLLLADALDLDRPPAGDLADRVATSARRGRGGGAR